VDASTPSKTPPKQATEMPPPSTPVVVRAKKSKKITVADVIDRMYNDNGDDENDDSADDNDDVASENDNNNDNDETNDEDDSVVLPDDIHIQFANQLPLPPVSPVLADGIAAAVTKVHVVSEKKATRKRQPPRRLYDLYSDETIAMLTEKKEKKDATAERKAQRLAAKEKKKVDDMVAKELKRRSQGATNEPAAKKKAAPKKATRKSATQKR
jgi:hypothetical protein